MTTGGSEIKRMTRVLAAAALLLAVSVAVKVRTAGGVLIVTGSF